MFENITEFILKKFKYELKKNTWSLLEFESKILELRKLGEVLINSICE